MAEIDDVMLKVAELSVTDDSSSVRLQCRQVSVWLDLLFVFVE